MVFLDKFVNSCIMYSDWVRSVVYSRRKECVTFLSLYIERGTTCMVYFKSCFFCHSFRSFFKMLLFLFYWATFQRCLWWPISLWNWPIVDQRFLIFLMSAELESHVSFTSQRKWFFLLVHTGIIKVWMEWGMWIIPYFKKNTNLEKQPYCSRKKPRKEYWIIHI